MKNTPHPGKRLLRTLAGTSFDHRTPRFRPMARNGSPEPAGKLVLDDKMW